MITNEEVTLGSQFDRPSQACDRTASAPGRDPPATLARAGAGLRPVRHESLVNVAAQHPKGRTDRAGDALRAHQVGQQLKRMDTIRDKLDREPRMSPARMHDIAGCRAVLPDQHAADTVIERLRAQRRWDLLPRTWDYVTEPKPDGYRAKHIVARKDGVLIALQIRTAAQHAWARLVERLDRSRDLQLKAGRADIETQELLA